MAKSKKSGGGGGGTKNRKNSSNQARIDRKRLRDGRRFGTECQMSSVFHEVAIGTRLHNRKGKSEPVEETQYERFHLIAPIGYKMEHLRTLLGKAVNSVVKNDRKSAKMEFVLERWPQVNTVMGEINAQLPKTQRVRFGYTTKEEENTLFVIEKTT